eukprot:TRINITY_DN1028_c0_g1_i1.p1 TRINITY_DN1028_c0_g1~~TRINITY_DN1028_c0_g1_i1.p1  ORF type:complete len:146 (-),score=19.18 TRINITY_DN1028_c0_g1_i1:257-694(-)
MQFHNCVLSGDTCQTVLIGVEIGNRARDNLIRIANSSNNCTFHEIGDNDIQEVFRRIQVTLSENIQVRVTGDANDPTVALNRQRKIEVELKFYAVYLDLDMSGSMSGRRWKSVVQGVRNYLQHLTPYDAMGCVLFNDGIAKLTQQ